jgi:phage tail sheath protein FI
VGPIILVNILDPANAAHVAETTGELHALDEDGEALVGLYGEGELLGVIKSTVVVKSQNGSTTYTLGTDYTLTFDDDGYLVVARVSGGAISAGAVLSLDFDYFDPSGVTADDIIGGVSGSTYTGLEVVKQVFPVTRQVPGLILAPGWSSEPEVAARMATIAHSINGKFRAMAVVDLSTDPYEIANYTEAAAWKADNGYTSVDMAVLWGKVKNGDNVYHLSTHFACLANRTDANNSGIPFESPSNKALTGTAMVLDDGTEVLLEETQANILNDQGIITALNGINGWKLWGNYTGGYPSTTDPKDMWVAVRRMFNWIGNTTVLTTDSYVDQPGNRRLIDGVRAILQFWVNSLIAQGALLGGKVSFRSVDNPTSDLLAGRYKWHVAVTPPIPGQELVFLVEYDPAALAALFA